MNKDPWQMSDSNALESSTLSDIFRALLGDPNGGVDLPYKSTRTNVLGFTTQDDLWSMIDWSDLDEKTSDVRDALGLTYYLDLKAKINIKKAFEGELVLHGVIPTLEWGFDSTGVREQWWIRFRKMGPFNKTAAYFSGREITESKLALDNKSVEQHSHTWIANKIECKTNLSGEKYLTEMNVSLKSSFMASGVDVGTVKIEAPISHFTPTDENVTNLTNHFRTILRYFAVPNWANKCDVLTNTFYNLALGRECLVTDRSVHHPATHALGLTEQPVFIVKMEQDLGGKGKHSITYRMANEGTYGWAPACYVATSSKQTIVVGGTTYYYINCTPSTHVFSSTTMRQDQMWFDCYTYTDGAGYVAKDCSCENYAVLATTLGDTTPTIIGGSGELVVTSVGYTPSATLVLQDTSAGHTHYDAWNDAVAHVIYFDTWPYLQSCQTCFVYFADDSNKLGSSDPGMKWV